MYCPKCGVPVSDDSNFCTMCGNTLNFIPRNVTNNSKKLYSYAIYIMALNAPLMFILRMLLQESEIRFGWKEYTYHYLPGNIQAVMVVLIAIFFATSLFLQQKSEVDDKKSKRKLYLGWLLSGIISYFIIFVN